MAIEKSENALGGITYTVPPKGKLSRLPARIRNLIDEFDRTVFLDPISYLFTVRDRCRYEPMKDWLAALAKGGFYQLQIHTADAYEDEPIHRVYFEFVVGGSLRLHGLRFRKEPPTGLVHPALHPIFDLVENIEPSIWGYAGGQLAYEEGPEGLFTNMGWLRPSDHIDASKCQSLYTSPDGNVIGCDADGRTIWCDHGELSVIGPIEEFLKAYFENLRLDKNLYDSHAFVEVVSRHSSSAR